LPVKQAPSDGLQAVGNGTTMNNVTEVGNITGDIKLTFANSGTAIASFSIAVTKKRGEEKVTSYFDCTAFGPLAEQVSKVLEKGNRVIVAGSLDQRSYEDKQGNKRSAVSILVDSVGPEIRFDSWTRDEN